MKNQNDIFADVLVQKIIDSKKNGYIAFEKEQSIENEQYYQIDKSDGMIISLHTDWGGGKTTLIDYISEKLSKENKIFFEKVNAWEFNKENKENLWQSVISFFYIKIIEKNINELKGKEHFKELISNLSLLNLAKLSTKILGLTTNIKIPFLEEFTKKLSDSDPKKIIGELKSNISLFYDMKENLKGILESNNIKEKYDKYIFVIDDLDRCSPMEVINLLDSLKIFLDIKNIIIIIAVDRRHIEKGIFEVYNKGNDGKYLINPDEYLEKIIHLPIDLFLFNNDIKNTIISERKLDNKIENLESKKEKGIKIKEILLKDENIYNYGLSNNPRKIIRFKRLFLFYYTVFEKLGFFNNNNNSDIKKTFLVFYLILKLEWGDYFQEINKKPISLYFVQGINKIEKLLEKYSIIFYEKKYENINKYKKYKLQSFIKFLKFFSQENNEIFKHIIQYYMEFQTGFIIKDDDGIGVKLLQNLVDINLYEKDFVENYISILQKITEGENFLEEISSTSLSKFEKNELEKIKKHIPNIQNNKGNIKNKEKHTIDISEKLKTNIVEFGNKYDTLDNNGKMIIGYIDYDEAIEEDPKRFILGNASFFQKIVKDENLGKLLTIKIQKIKSNTDDELEEHYNYQEYISKKIHIDDIDDMLGSKHILKNLLNDPRRTLFGEIINQMSFAKSGPSVGGLVGSTDFNQLESYIIQNLPSDQINNWIKTIKNAIIVDCNKLEEQLKNYKKMITFINEKIESGGIKRLEKRLIYIFSHIWALQDIKKFPVYYGKSKNGLEKLGLWSNNYGDLDNALENYKNFCIIFNRLTDILDIDAIRKNMEEDMNESISLNEKFKEFYHKDDNYIKDYLSYRVIQDYLFELNNEE